MCIIKETDSPYDQRFKRKSGSSNERKTMLEVPVEPASASQHFCGRKDKQKQFKCTYGACEYCFKTNMNKM